jgi:hypothetical protein
MAAWGFHPVDAEIAPENTKFPCIYPADQGMPGGDGFASDCVIHHPVPRVSDISENRSKSGERDTGAGVRNFPLDLCFGDLATKALGGENAPNRGFGRFAARFIRRNQIRGHDENAPDHGDSAIADGQADVRCRSASGYPATKPNGWTLIFTRFRCSLPRDESRNVRARTDA